MTPRSEYDYCERPPSGEYAWPNNGEIYERMRCSLLVEADKAEAAGDSAKAEDVAELTLDDNATDTPASASAAAVSLPEGELPAAATFTPASAEEAAAGLAALSAARRPVVIGKAWTAAPQGAVRLSSAALRGVSVLTLDDLYVTVGFDVFAGHFAGTFFADRQRFRSCSVQFDRNLLDVQDNVGSVFHNALDRREFMLNALDLDCGDRCSFDRRQESTADRVADRCAESTLKRSCVEFTVTFRKCFRLNIQTARHLEICPITLCHIFKKFQVSGLRFRVRPPGLSKGTENPKL